MEVTVERPQPCEAVLTITVDDAQMEQARERASREYARYVNVPGFRPGKAPRHLVEQSVGAESLEKHAREIVVQIAYKVALESEGIEPYDQATVEDIDSEDGEPFKFRANIPLRPDVELGDMTNLIARWNPIQITDDDVQREIDAMLIARATVEPTTDPITDGAMVFCDLTTTVDGVAIGDTRSASFNVGANMPEIDGALRGAAAGDTRECDVDYPESYSDEALAGKTVHFTLQINHVLAKRVPELNDEWARTHTDVQTEAELRSALRANLDAKALNDAEEDVRLQLLGEIVMRSQVNFPSRLVDREVADDLRKFSSSLEERGGNLDDYLQRTNHSLPQLQDEMAITATKRIKNGLVMGKVAQVEGISVTREETDVEIAKMAVSRNMKPKDLRRRLKDEGALGDLEDTMLQAKFFDLLKSRAEIDGYPAAEESE